MARLCPAPHRPQNSSEFWVADAVNLESIHRNHAESQHVVHRHAETAGQESKATAQRQSRRASLRDGACRNNIAVLLRRGVQLSQEHAGLDRGNPVAPSIVICFINDVSMTNALCGMACPSIPCPPLRMAIARSCSTQ